MTNYDPTPNSVEFDDNGRVIEHFDIEADNLNEALAESLGRHLATVLTRGPSAIPDEHHTPGVIFVALLLDLACAVDDLRTAVRFTRDAGLDPRVQKVLDDRIEHYRAYPTYTPEQWMALARAVDAILDREAPE